MLKAYRMIHKRAFFICTIIRHCNIDVDHLEYHIDIYVMTAFGIEDLAHCNANQILIGYCLTAHMQVPLWVFFLSFPSWL